LTISVLSRAVHHLTLQRTRRPYRLHGTLEDKALPIIRVEPSRLYRRIADQIRELILAGEFPAGSRLPPERDLAQQFGVSRPSLREALIALEISGFVTVMTGSGIYVRTDFAGAEPAAVPDGGPGPFELIRARHLIESEVAAVAAREATPSDIESPADRQPARPYRPAWFAGTSRSAQRHRAAARPDHYLFRMLYSQGVPLERLGVPRRDAADRRADPREAWRLFASRFHLFRGTPIAAVARPCLRRSVRHRRRLDAATADHYFDR
jgi:hypothetical protein